MVGDSSDVRKLFDESLKSKFNTLPEVLHMLLNHERKKVCLDNLCAEIIRMNKRKLLFELNTFKDVITTTANMFALKCLQYAEEQSLSSIEKIRRRTESDRIETAKDVMHELQKDGVFKKID